MNKDIEISYITIEVPELIKVDGIEYPITQHNIDVVKEYWKTGDTEILGNGLKNGVEEQKSNDKEIK